MDVFPKVYPPCQDSQASLQGIQRQRWKEEERESGEKQQQPPFWDSVKLTTDSDIIYYDPASCSCGYHIIGKEVNENLYCMCTSRYYKCWLPSKLIDDIVVTLFWSNLAQTSQREADPREKVFLASKVTDDIVLVHRLVCDLSYMSDNVVDVFPLIESLPANLKARDYNLSVLSWHPGLRLWPGSANLTSGTQQVALSEYL